VQDLVEPAIGVAGLIAAPGWAASSRIDAIVR
jgi:hypothetical protein